MNIRLVTLVVSLCASAGVGASSLDVNLSTDAARVKFLMPVSGETLERAALEVGLIYNDDSDWIANAGLLVFGDPAPQAVGLTLGAGAQLYGGSVESQDFASIGLGGVLRYVFPAANRFAIGASAFYAPKIVSFGDSDETIDAELRAEYEILRTVAVHVGVRRVRIEDDNGRDLTVDSGGFVGLTMKF